VSHLEANTAAKCCRSVPQSTIRQSLYQVAGIPSAGMPCASLVDFGDFPMLACQCPPRARSVCQVSPDSRSTSSKSNKQRIPLLISNHYLHAVSKPCYGFVYLPAIVQPILRRPKTSIPKQKPTDRVTPYDDTEMARRRVKLKRKPLSEPARICCLCWIWIDRCC
jgi:hypothetical protein